MLRRLAVATLASLVAGSVALVALAAPPNGAPAHAGKTKDDPADAKHKQFLDAVKDGTAKYAAKDVSGAIDAFQKATQQEPRNPLGYYLLGEAQLGNGDLSQAESAYLHASQVSDEGSIALKAKIFFVVADLRERQKRWDDAKASWEQYGEVAAKVPDGLAFPQVAKERIASIDAMLAQDKAYEIVRKRIAEEKAKAGTPPAH